MKVITESEMNFGKFDEADFFHIEDSKIYKKLGSSIKTVEFILKYDKNSIVFLEAKKRTLLIVMNQKRKNRNLKNIIHL